MVFIPLLYFTARGFATDCVVLFAVYQNAYKNGGDKTKMPLYGIFSNEQLALMAQNPPTTKEAFMKIKGVTEQKFNQFGEVFLNVIKKALLSAQTADDKAIKEN